jgi:tRNA threonylcarbamoyladenosine biosynthesis protein TsaE
MGGREILYGGGISVIEWSERIPRSIPPEAIVIEIFVEEGEKRSFKISGMNPGEIQR